MVEHPTNPSEGLVSRRRFLGTTAAATSALSSPSGLFGKLLEILCSPVPSGGSASVSPFGKDGIITTLLLENFDSGISSRLWNGHFEFMEIFGRMGVSPDSVRSPDFATRYQSDQMPALLGMRDWILSVERLQEERDRISNLVDQLPESVRRVLRRGSIALNHMTRDFAENGDTGPLWQSAAKIEKDLLDAIGPDETVKKTIISQINGISDASYKLNRGAQSIFESAEAVVEACRRGAQSDDSSSQNGKTNKASTSNEGDSMADSQEFEILWATHGPASAKDLLDLAMPRAEEFL